MAEADKKVDQKVDDVVEEKEEEGGLSPRQEATEALKEKARKQGWKPLKEWDGNPEDWRPAKEFVERGEMLKQIKGLKTELVKRDLRQEEENKLIRQHLQDMKTLEYNRAKEDLEAAQKRAIQNEDVAEATKIERKLAKIDSQIEQAELEKKQISQTKSQVSPEFLEWVEKNSWYNDNGAARIQADAFAYAYIAQHSGAPNSQVLEYVEKQMKKVNPELFGSGETKVDDEVKVKKTSSVEGNGTGGRGSTQVGSGKKGKYGPNDLTAEQFKIYNMLVKERKIVSEADYWKDFEQNLNRS